jgi:GPH family glycoside/pentoside/hexuronide:cation symporter
VEPKEKLKLWKSFSLLFKNKYFMLILAYYLTSYLFNGIYSGLGIYYATYNLGNAALLGALSMATLVPTIVLLPVVPQLTGKFGLRTTSIIGMLISLAGGVVAFFGGTLGLIPILMGGAVVYSAGKAPMTGATNAMIAAADDYANLKFGQRMTGTIFACSSVGMKVGTGIGTAVCGFILEWSKFDGQANTQSEQTLSMIQSSYLSTFLLIPLTAVVILFFLNVEKVNRKLKEGAQIAEND